MLSNKHLTTIWFEYTRDQNTEHSINGQSFVCYSEYNQNSQQLAGNWVAEKMSTIWMVILLEDHLTIKQIWTIQTPDLYAIPILTATCIFWPVNESCTCICIVRHKKKAWKSSKGTFFIFCRRGSCSWWGKMNIFSIKHWLTSKSWLLPS